MVAEVLTEVRGLRCCQILQLATVCPFSYPRCTQFDAEPRAAQNRRAGQTTAAVKKQRVRNLNLYLRFRASFMRYG